MAQLGLHLTGIRRRPILSPVEKLELRPNTSNPLTSSRNSDYQTGILDSKTLHNVRMRKVSDHHPLQLRQVSHHEMDSSSDVEMNVLDQPKAFFFIQKNKTHFPKPSRALGKKGPKFSCKVMNISPVDATTLQVKGPGLDIDPSVYKKFTHLKSIHFSSISAINEPSQITQEVIDAMPSSLENIKFELSPIKAFDFSGFSNLKSITFDRCGIQLESISLPHSLENLMMIGGNVGKFSFTKSQFPNLKSVTLQHIRGYLSDEQHMQLNAVSNDIDEGESSSYFGLI